MAERKKYSFDGVEYYNSNEHELALDGKIEFEGANIEIYLKTLCNYLLKVTMNPQGRKLIKSLAKPGEKTFEEFWKVLMYLMAIDMFGVSKVEDNEYYEKKAWEILHLRNSKEYLQLFKVTPKNEETDAIN